MRTWLGVTALGLLSCATSTDSAGSGLEELPPAPWAHVPAPQLAHAPGAPDILLAAAPKREAAPLETDPALETGAEEAAPAPEPEDFPLIEDEEDALVLAAVTPSATIGPVPAPPPDVEPPHDVRTGGPKLKPVATVRTGVQPKSVYVSPDGAQVWVANFGFSGRDNVYVYSAESLEQIATIEFEGNAVETAFSPDGTKAYVSNFKMGQIEVIDRADFSVVAEIDVGTNPKMMAPTPDGQSLYVANWTSNTISVVDLPSQTEQYQIPTGQHPRGMALRSDGTLFAVAMFDHRIHVISPGDREETRGFGACKFPRHLAFSPDETRLYVACSGTDQIRWYDPESGKRMNWVRVGDQPRSMSLGTDGRFVALADFTSSTVSLLDTATMKRRTHQLPGAKQVVGVAVQPGDGLRVYATSWMTRELFVLEPS